MKRLLLATTSLFLATAAFAQSASMQSPAYQECSALATSDPAQALVKADAWLKIDTGIAAQHCRAMALYGMRRFPEAAAALSTARDTVAPENIALRSYVTRQTARAYINANEGDKALALLGGQITEISNYRNDNGNAAHLASDLLRERARINASYGKLDEAAKDLDHAVSLTPVNEELLLERSAVFEQLGDLPLARNDVDAVLTINSGNAKARATRDRLYGGVAAGAVAIPSAVAAPYQTQPMATGQENVVPVKAVKKRAKKKRAVKPVAVAAPTPAVAIAPVAPETQMPAAAMPVAKPVVAAPVKAVVQPTMGTVPPLPAASAPALPAVMKPVSNAIVPPQAPAPAVAPAPVAQVPALPALPAMPALPPLKTAP